MQMMHLLRHVGGILVFQNVPEMLTSPTCWPDVERTVASPIVVLFRALALLHRMGSTHYKKEGEVS